MAESILHFGAVTIRVNGTGVMRMTLLGLDDDKSFVLNTFTMSSLPGREPTVLANFNSQRARLRIQTTGIDEYMKVNRVVLFVKQVATSFPNGGR